MKHSISITPKEGAGRSNRLGDANKNKGLQNLSVSPLFNVSFYVSLFSCFSLWEFVLGG